MGEWDELEVFEKPKSLGAMVMGPRKVVPPGAKLTTVNAKPKQELQTKMPSTSVSANGTSETNENKLKKSSQEGKNLEMKIQENSTTTATPKDAVIMPDTEKKQLPATSRELSAKIPPAGFIQKYETSRKAVSEVMNSLDSSEKRLVACIESQGSCSEKENATIVLESSKALLVNLKLKLDAAKMIREMGE